MIRCMRTLGGDAGMTGALEGVGVCVGGHGAGSVTRGGFVARCKSFAIFRRAFCVSSPASKYGRGFGGFCKMATISCAAWRRSVSVVTSGKGM